MRKITFGDSENVVLKENDLEREVKEPDYGVITEKKTFYSIQEVADAINMSYDFVSQKIREGKIISIRFGDRIQVHYEELLRIVNTGL